ncbi:DEAD/DEAH box helicase family protein [Rhodoflexus sp.]
MLHEEIRRALTLLPAEEFAPTAWVRHHLNPRFPLRSYQVEAYRALMYALQTPQAQRHLLFQMATGSGKTLLMAAALLGLYRKGYRHFIFLVNSTSIIEKTRYNFLHRESEKYLFQAQETDFSLQETSYFYPNSSANAAAGVAYIHFTTVQSLHRQLLAAHENAFSWEDLRDIPLVIISDEAHHLNASTKKGTVPKSEQAEIQSWEEAVQRIFSAHQANLLLEFTATAYLEHPEIAAKYADKLIYDYPLSRFREEGYSKEVRVWQSNAPPFERALQAAMLSQWRLKTAEQYGQALKPVVLFKSKTIRESERFYAQFTEQMQQLTAEKVAPLLAAAPLQPLANYLQQMPSENSINLFINELQDSFAPNRLLIVNSKDDSEEKQLLLNTLESPRNLYRAVFAVDKLNEGWDVLNLFDIVRLYDTANPTRQTTVAEAQLIGRGARYCPLFWEGAYRYRRCFDDNAEHPLRLCETLYYHSAYHPQYIRSLHEAMQSIGLEAKKTERQAAQRKVVSPRRSWVEIWESVRNMELVVRGDTHNGENNMELVVREDTHKGKGNTRRGERDTHNSRTAVNLGQLPYPILRKAAKMHPFYRMEHLLLHFPNLHSVQEFLTSPDYLGNIRLLWHEPAAPDAQLAAVNQALAAIADALQPAY